MTLDIRRTVAAALAVSMLACLPLQAAAGSTAKQQTQNTASIGGTAKASNGQTMASAKVQLRDINTGDLVGTTTSDAEGGFSFTGLAGGTYTVEVLSATGEIVGASAAVSVAAGAAVTGVTVGASAAAAAGAASGAAAAAGAAAAGGATAASVSTAVIVSTVAA